jgi:hypothetical protein
VRLTQSVLSTAGDCQLRAQYTLEPPAWVRRTAGSTRALGTAFHAALEYFYLYRTGSPRLDELIGVGTETFDKSCVTDLYDNTPVEVFNWDAKVPDRETAITYLSAMLAEYLLHAWPTDWTVLAVEHNEWFNDPAVGADVQTKLGCDLILLDPNDFVVAVDFKTAGKAWPEHKEHPRKNTQSPFYMRNLRRAFPGHAGYRRHCMKRRYASVPATSCSPTKRCMSRQAWICLRTPRATFVRQNFATFLTDVHSAQR